MVELSSALGEKEWMLVPDEVPMLLGSGWAQEHAKRMAQRLGYSNPPLLLLLVLLVYRTGSKSGALAARDTHSLHQPTSRSRHCEEGVYTGGLQLQATPQDPLGWTGGV